MPDSTIDLGRLVLKHNHPNDCPACKECEAMRKFYKDKVELQRMVARDAVAAMLTMQQLINYQSDEIQRLTVRLEVIEPQIITPDSPG